MFLIYLILLHKDIIALINNLIIILYYFSITINLIILNNYKILVRIKYFIKI
jgi:hypothetical protein